jgi:crotonobetainyl-CoA:carnitine CoA-transferase CaiB-like acyl-CoA transferase
MYRLPLFDHRVIDLADGTAACAGRLLGDMGAEVVKIEPLSADSLRGSALFHVLNSNKYSCAIDVTKRPDLLLELAGLSDIVIATGGSIDSQELRSANDGLIVVTLPEEAGVACAVAAAGAVGLALWDRRRTGRGGLIEMNRLPGEPTAYESVPPAEIEPVSTLEGVIQIPASPWHMSETPPHVRLPAPTLAEHNAYVLGSLLGLTEEEIAALEAEGVAGRAIDRSVRG